MKRTLLSAFAAAALLSAAASTSAIGKAESSFLLPTSEPLHPVGIGRIGAAEPTASGHFKTAFTYIDMLVARSGRYQYDKQGGGTKKAAKRANKATPRRK